MELVDSDTQVAVVAPQWSGYGLLEMAPKLECSAARLSGAPGSLATDRMAGARALWRLRRAAKRVKADLWLCHWWPTRFALPRDATALVVLHGSDVDLFARLPRVVRRWVARRLRCVAVAPGVAGRFAELAGVERPMVLPIGARGPSGEAPSFPREVQAWTQCAGRRVLTVGRDEAGKGWRTVAGAAPLLPDVSWLGVQPKHQIGPEGVRQLIAHADLVVVPSEDGAALPSEGRPHVITQAMVAGVPVVGGPNVAVREALDSYGQVTVTLRGSSPLAREVARALEPELHRVLRDRAREAGRELDWAALAPKWRQLLREAGRQPGRQRTLERPSC